MIKRYIAKYQEQARLRNEELIKSEFRVVERDGSLWLTHQGVAFLKVSALSNAGDVAKFLNEARANAVEFERL